MRILAINCGSSSLKFELMESPPSGSHECRAVASGIVREIGRKSSASFRLAGEASVEMPVQCPNHGEATRLAVGWLRQRELLRNPPLAAVGHRVVHGGEKFFHPARIDQPVIDEIATLRQLAPLHNGVALEAILMARELFGTGMPMVATFDTAFHRGMPAVAEQYAIPPQLAQKHHIRRYGFHGLAHRHMLQRYAEMSGRAEQQARIITVQLGAGCSAAAIAGGRSVDTSMGFTPLEGLMMATRCGDIDAAVLPYLARREGVEPEDVENWLNRHSGLIGVSGLSQDMRELLEAESAGHEGARMAVEMFCYRVRRYTGALLAALGGAEAIVFGGGIGENSPAVRRRICEPLQWCGVQLDGERNDGMIRGEGRISVDGSRIAVYVAAVNEGAVIVRDTLECLTAAGVILNT